MNGTNLNTVTVDGVKYDRAKYEASQTKTAKKNDSLGKDAFLQLLVTQLRHQHAVHCPACAVLVARADDTDGQRL